MAKDFPPASGIFQMLDSAPPSMCSASYGENYFHCADVFLRQPIAGRLLIDKKSRRERHGPGSSPGLPRGQDSWVAIRDPRDVVMSCFMQSLTLTPVSSAYLTLGGTVNQYANVMDFWRVMLPRLGEQGMYKFAMRRWWTICPVVARSVLGFLGLGFEENVLKFLRARSDRETASIPHPPRRQENRFIEPRWAAGGITRNTLSHTSLAWYRS